MGYAPLFVGTHKKALLIGVVGFQNRDEFETFQKARSWAVLPYGHRLRPDTYELIKRRCTATDKRKITYKQAL